MVAATLAFAFASGCGARIDGTPASSPQADSREAGLARVAPEKLRSLLPDAATINAIMGGTEMTVLSTLGALTVPEAAISVSNPDCLGAVFTVTEPAYRGSGYLKTVGLSVTEPGDVRAHTAFPNVVAYPSGGEALAFAERSATQWSDCADQTVSFRRTDGETDTWSIGTPVTTDGVITVLNYQEGGGGWRCAHSLTARTNVVIDVDACSSQASAKDSTTIVDAIVAKLPA